MLFFLHNYGNQITNSIGSTSEAITTNDAYLFSTNYVIWFNPYFRVTGFFVSGCYLSIV